ncbi:MAG: hypothetical protein Q8O56_18180 [Solirubrobacteraceae bacterium]|nr:hypothetical protein [Solirubrobacteraceae bacterium]
MRSRSALISRVLVAAFAITIVGSQLLLYADRNVFDSARFADHAAVALDDGAVRQQVAQALTREIVRADPDAIVVEPLIQAVATGVVGSTPFRALVRNGVLRTHSAVFDDEQDALVVTVADGALLVVQALRQLNPGAARSLPDDVDVALLSVSDATGGQLLTGAAQTAEAVRSAGWILLAAALAFAILAIVSSPDRRRTVRTIGFTLAGAGLALVVALQIARGLVTGQAPSEGGEAALRAVWDAYLGDFVALQISVVIAGLVLASVAESVLRPVGLAPRLRQLGAMLSRRPEHTWARAVRAGGLTLGGVLIIFDPLSALRLVALAAGLVVLSAGVDELLRLTARPRPAEQPVEQPERQRAPARPSWRRLAVAAGLAVGALSLPAIVVASTDGPSGTTEAVACNGAPELCDKRLDEVVVAATHNSMSSPQSGFLFPDQDSPIPAQLRGGIRGLLIDTHMGIRTSRGVFTMLAEGGKSRAKIEQAVGPAATATAKRLRDRSGTPDGAPRAWLCHGFCELGAIDAVTALKQVKEFLVAHPHEVLVISIEDQISPAATVDVFRRSGLLDRVWKGAIEPLPTLRAMIDRDERVLVFGEEDTAGVPWYHQQFDAMVETPYDIPSAKELLDARGCRPGRGTPGAPLGLLNHWVARTPPRPSVARTVNDAAAVARRARDCATALGGEVNVIAVDFWGEGDVVGAADRLNRATGP